MEGPKTDPQTQSPSPYTREEIKEHARRTVYIENQEYTPNDPDIIKARNLFIDYVCKLPPYMQTVLIESNVQHTLFPSQAPDAERIMKLAPTLRGKTLSAPAYNAGVYTNHVITAHALPETWLHETAHMFDRGTGKNGKMWSDDPDFVAGVTKDLASLAPVREQIELKEKKNFFEKTWSDCKKAFKKTQQWLGINLPEQKNIFTEHKGVQPGLPLDAVAEKVRKSIILSTRKYTKHIPQEVLANITTYYFSFPLQNYSDDQKSEILEMAFPNTWPQYRDRFLPAVQELADELSAKKARRTLIVPEEYRENAVIGPQTERLQKQSETGLAAASLPF